MTQPPLRGLKVLDFSQFLAGPYASLRLADLGAEVIKVERTGKGDLSRYLYVSDVMIDGESSIFHAINRGKKSIAVDLKSDAGQARIWDLIEDADVVIQNFRPGVIERLGFGYEAVRRRKPTIVYGSISGYGAGHDWQGLPGQDLLAQARSGIMWLSGSATDGPVAFGLPVADILAGAALAQGILALLVQRGISGQGGHVETSLLEAIVDLQFELLSTHLNNNFQLPDRPKANAAHAFLAAPYGVYQTSDGYIAIAMNDIDALFRCLGMAARQTGLDPFADRDRIQAQIAHHVAGCDTISLIRKMEADDIWAAPVMDWHDLRGTGILNTLDCLGRAERGGQDFAIVKSPIRINGTRPFASGAAPYLGSDQTGWDKNSNT